MNTTGMVYGECLKSLAIISVVYVAPVHLWSAWGCTFGPDTWDTKPILTSELVACGLALLWMSHYPTYRNPLGCSSDDLSDGATDSVAPDTRSV